jgi:hypothetical protein
VAEDQPVDAGEHLVLGGAGRAVELVEQTVELDVLVALAGQDAARPAQLVDGLVGDGSHDGLLRREKGTRSCPAAGPAIPAGCVPPPCG